MMQLANCLIVPLYRPPGDSASRSSHRSPLATYIWTSQDHSQPKSGPRNLHLDRTRAYPARTDVSPRARSSHTSCTEVTIRSRLVGSVV